MPGVQHWFDRYSAAGGTVTGSITPGGLPTPETTGWQPTGVTLTPYTGPTTVTAGGTVIDSKDISATTGNGIAINSSGSVTIKRSRITAAGGDGAFAVDIRGTGPVILEDCEIRSLNVNAPNNSGQFHRSVCTGVAPASRNGGLRMTRVYAYGGIAGVDFTSDDEAILIEDCYLYPNYNPGVGERDHTTAVRASGNVTGLTINNTVLGVGEDCWASGIIATYPENGPNANLTINGGLWIVNADNSGAYGIAAGYTPPGESPNHDFHVTGLQISTEFYAAGCPSGVGQNWNQLTGTNTWSATKYHPGFADHGQSIGP
jgi:hypothetical protein